jgi:TPR repeat protein
MGSSLKSAQFLIDSRIADAARGDAGALYDLGMVYSSGASGVGIDLVEAHKWFNLAAVAGSEEAMACRSEIAGDMSPREISVAQKAARAWLAMSGARPRHAA